VLLTQQISAPSVVVVGQTVQPVLLATAGTLPCLLLPAPDIVVVMPSFFLHVPLPPGLRPLTFVVQEVTLTPNGLRTSDAYVVTAN
jgi:hypothetical protein